MDAIDRTFRHLVQTIQNHFPAHLDQPFEVAELYQTILPYRHHRRELGFETNQDYELVLLQLLSGARDYLIVDDAMREALARELASPTPSAGAFREFNTSQVSLNPEAVERLTLDSGEGAADRAAAAPAAPKQPAPEARPSASATTQRISVSRTRAASGAAGAAMSGAAGSGSSMGEGASATTARTASASQQDAPREPRPPARASQAAQPAAPRAQASAATPTPGAARANLSTRTATPTTGRTTGIVVQPGEPCRYCAGALPSGRRITFCPHCGQNLTVVNCMACGTELELGWKFCTTCGRPVSS